MDRYSTCLCILLCLFVLVNSAPVKSKGAKRGHKKTHVSTKGHHGKGKFREEEYDITLKRVDQNKYFVRPGEFQNYFSQFNKIFQLGESFECKSSGGRNCRRTVQATPERVAEEEGRRREEIGSIGYGQMVRPDIAPEYQVPGYQRSNPAGFIDLYEQPGEQQGGFAANGPVTDQGEKKSLTADMMVPEYHPEIPQDGSYHDNAETKQNIPAEATLNSPVFPPVKPESYNVNSPRPGGDIYSQQKNAAQFGQQPQLDIKMPNAMNQEMMSKQHDDVIQSAAQDKINFMDKAIGGPDIPSRFEPGAEGAPGGPGAGAGGGQKGPESDGMHGLPSNPNSAVSESDIMKAEGIQPNEMNDLNNFLEDSNKMNPQAERGEAEMSDGKFVSNPLGHFGEAMPQPPSAAFHTPKDDTPAHDMIGTSLPDSGSHHHDEGEEHDGPEHGPPGNVIGGAGGPHGSGGPSADFTGNPSVDFVEENTRKMMDTNSDYQVPGTAFGNLWKDFMTSTQSQLGENDPSANSREGIEHVSPVTSAIKHGDISRPEKESSQKAAKRSEGQKRHHKKKSSVHRHHRGIEEEEVKRVKKSDVGRETKKAVARAIEKLLPSKSAPKPAKQRSATGQKASSVVQSKSTPAKTMESRGTNKSHVKKNAASVMFVPMFVVNSLMSQFSKKNSGLKGAETQKAKNSSQAKAASPSKKQFLTDKKIKKSEPPFFVTQQGGKRFLVMNMDSPAISGFAQVGSHFMKFNVPLNDDVQPVIPPTATVDRQESSFINGMPAIPLPSNLPMFNNYDGYRGSYNGYRADVRFNGYQGYRGYNGYGSYGPPERYRNNYAYPQMYGMVPVPVMTPMGEFPGYNNQQQDTFGGGYDSGRVIPDRNYEAQFMWGPAFNGNEYHNSEFESMSTVEHTVPGGLYHDPVYNPHETESFYPDGFPGVDHTRYHGTPQDIRRLQEFAMQVEDQPTEEGPMMVPNAAPDPNARLEPGGMDDDPGIGTSMTFESDEQPNPFMNSMAPMQANMGQMHSSTGRVHARASHAKWSDQKGEKRTARPFVFTKEHVGFGQITVEAKTANAPMSDPDDDDS